VIERPLAGAAGDTLESGSDQLRVLFVAKRFPYPGGHQGEDPHGAASRGQWRRMKRFGRDAYRCFAGFFAVSEADRRVFAEWFVARRTFAGVAAEAHHNWRHAASGVYGRLFGGGTP
jgi:hypothetical protein